MIIIILPFFISICTIAATLRNSVVLFVYGHVDMMYPCLLFLFFSSLPFLHICSPTSVLSLVAPFVQSSKPLYFFFLFFHTSYPHFHHVGFFSCCEVCVCACVCVPFPFLYRSLSLFFLLLSITQYRLRQKEHMLQGGGGGKKILRRRKKKKYIPLVLVVTRYLSFFLQVFGRPQSSTRISAHGSATKKQKGGRGFGSPLLYI